MVTTRRAGTLVACLVLVLGGVPIQGLAGVSGASDSGEGSQSQQNLAPAVEDALGCYPGVALSDISMTVTRQTATNLQTQGARAVSDTNGGDETFRLSAERVDAEQICLRSVSATDGGTIAVKMKGVDLRGVTIQGPADIAFDRGTADSMTVWMPPSSALKLLAQIPGALGPGSSGNETGTGPVGNATDPVDNALNETTDAVNDTTDTVNDTIDNTTDTIDNTTDAVDDAVDNTTDTVDETVDDTTDSVENSTDAVDNTTDAVDNTTDAVDDTVNETTDAVEESVNETTDTVDQTSGALNVTTDAVTGVTNETTDALTDAANETTDLLGSTTETLLGTATESS